MKRTVGKAGRAPVLVLGLGNALSSDDAIGLYLLHELTREADEWGRRVQFVGGGTGAGTLLDEIRNRSAVLVLQAVSTGADPGTIHILREQEVLDLAGRESPAGHARRLIELLETASSRGAAPERLLIVGVEAAQLKSGNALSPPVRQAITPALKVARSLIRESLRMLPAAA